jgi:hypothetical protein
MSVYFKTGMGLSPEKMVIFLFWLAGFILGMVIVCRQGPRFDIKLICRCKDRES